MNFDGFQASIYHLQIHRCLLSRRDEVVAVDQNGDVIEREAPTKTRRIPKHARTLWFVWCDFAASTESSFDDFLLSTMTCLNKIAFLWWFVISKPICAETSKHSALLAPQEFRDLGQFGSTGSKQLAGFIRECVCSLFGKSFWSHSLARLDPVAPDQLQHVADSAMTGMVGLRIPAFFVLLSCLCNTGCYAIEFATFAIYFKEAHNWSDVAGMKCEFCKGDEKKILRDSTW